MKNFELNLYRKQDAAVFGRFWRNEATGFPLICHDGLEDEIVVPEGQTELVAVVSTLKPRHQQFYHLRSSTNQYSSCLREYTLDTTAALNELVFELYEKGYRYAWIEYA